MNAQDLTVSLSKGSRPVNYLKMWLLLLMILPENVRNRKSVKVTAVLVVIGTLLFWWFNFPFKKVSITLREVFGDDKKTILFWNAPDRREVQMFGVGHDVFVNQGCAYTQCEIFTNRSQRPIDSYDAIVIFNDGLLWPDQIDLPENRTTRNQRLRLIFFTVESPLALSAYYNISSYANYFNWTMTYRLDSDIPMPYGRIVAKESAPWTPEEVNRRRENARRFQRPRVGKKSKIIAWIVSNCTSYSQREEYVKELSNYVTIDIYGACGNLTNYELENYNVSDYKFHLSFENALCPDYVTEEFFQIMEHDIVPVVFGGANYTKHAPPFSYINAREFKPKELAVYLKLLDQNDTLYNEYFWWKDDYRVESSVEDMSRHGFCDLCRKLHQRFEFNSYPELDSVWGENNQCTSFDPKWIT